MVCCKEISPGLPKKMASFRPNMCSIDLLSPEIALEFRPVISREAEWN